MNNRTIDILVVDDDDGMRKALQTRLSSVGYRVRAVASGEDALLACAPKRPDVILLDIEMPGIDGYEVCERIRRSVKEPMAVIFITGAADGPTSRRLEQRIEGAGGDYFLSKPYDASLLISLIERIVAENEVGVGR